MIPARRYPTIGDNFSFSVIKPNNNATVSPPVRVRIKSMLCGTPRIYDLPVHLPTFLTTFHNNFWHTPAHNDMDFQSTVNCNSSSNRTELLTLATDLEVS